MKSSGQPWKSAVREYFTCDIMTEKSVYQIETNKVSLQETKIRGPAKTGVDIR